MPPKGKEVTLRKSHLCMLVLLTISVAAVGVSVVTGADNSPTAEITPEPPVITPESQEITLESMEVEAELLNSGEVPVSGFTCQVCPVQQGFCQDPNNLFKVCQTSPVDCFCSYCPPSGLNCWEPFDL